MVVLVELMGRTRFDDERSAVVDNINGDILGQ